MDRRTFWKQEAERLYRAGDMKMFAVAERALESWAEWERNEREALKEIEAAERGGGQSGS